MALIDLRINELIHIGHLKQCLADYQASVSIQNMATILSWLMTFSVQECQMKWLVETTGVLRGNTEPTWGHMHSHQPLAS